MFRNCVVPVVLWLFSSICRRGDPPVISAEGREGTFHIMSDYASGLLSHDRDKILVILTPRLSLHRLDLLHGDEGATGVWRYPSKRGSDDAQDWLRYAYIVLHHIPSSLGFPLRFSINRSRRASLGYSQLGGNH